MDWIVKSFHPICNDVQWLRQRFDAFCQAKLHIDFAWAQTRLKHAPVHAKVLHKLFGRHDPISSFLLHHGEDKNLFESYISDVFGEKGIEKRMMETTKDRIALACALTGPLRDAKQVMGSLLTDRSGLTVDTLMLFELVHMTIFCKEEYMSNVKASHQGIVDYICHLVEKASLNETCLPLLAIDSDGLETQTLLRNVTSLVMSCYPIKCGQVEMIQVACTTEEENDDDLCAHDNNISHRATLNEMKGRLIVKSKKAYHKKF